MSKKIFVYFLLNSKKRYISSLTKLQTGKYIPEYDDKIENAHPFEPGHVKKTIKNLHNPYLRKFYTEEVNVSEVINSAQVHRAGINQHPEFDSTNVGDTRFY